MYLSITKELPAGTKMAESNEIIMSNIKLMNTAMQLLKKRL